MSFSGRSGNGGRGRGRGRATRGGRFQQKGSNGRGANSNTVTSKKYEFTAIEERGQKYHSYDTIKDHLANNLQQLYGEDIGNSIRNLEYVDLSQEAPVRIRVQKQLDMDSEEVAFKQESMDMQYQSELKTYTARVNEYRINKGKAYAEIIKCCNKTMKDRIESDTSFESTIMNDPVELLQAI